MSNTFYNEILIEHNLHPTHKHELPDANLVLEGVNPSCGDDIWLKLKVENDEIVKTKHFLIHEHILLLVHDFSVNTNRYNLPGNKFSAVLKRFFCCHFETAAARNFHS